ncbi:MAG TPA: large conductance mechanosensitive channel protein MscL [Actinomycetes bacterium]|nr:large conductance mechanosensitive channel protein MscL [Actinomycetes bacterium]
MKGFKDFIMRGNVIDLAVAIVIGLAITAIITAIVDSLIMPLLAALFGEPDFHSVGATEINDAQFYPGDVLTAVVEFLLIAAAVYFLIVLPMNKLREMRAKDETVPPTEIELLTEIRDALVTRNEGR